MTILAPFAFLCSTRPENQAEVEKTQPRTVQDACGALPRTVPHPCGTCAAVRAQKAVQPRHHPAVRFVGRCRLVFGPQTSSNECESGVFVNIIAPITSQAA